MKSASFPSFDLEPALRKAVEDVLEEGESPAQFMEQAIRDGVTLRRSKIGLIDSAHERRCKDGNVGNPRFADDVLASLETMLAEAKKKFSADINDPAST